MKKQYNVRAWLAYAHDVVAVCVTWFAAYWLRFNLSIPSEYFMHMLKALPWAVVLYALVFFQFGLYRGIWRYASLHDIKRIITAVFFGTSLLTLVIYMISLHVVIPRSVFVVQPILLIVLMGGSRLAYRSWKEHRMYGPIKRQGKPALILGAGDAALLLVKEMERSQQWRVAGLLDDDKLKHGRMLNGVKVLGQLSDIAYWAEKFDAKHVIIAMPSAPHEVRRRAVELCSAVGLRILTIPSYKDIMSGKVTVSQVRKVELEDLLGRDPVSLDDAGVRGYLGRKVVMVTGAAGSIGSELCRQIAAFKPSLLVLFEANEFAMYRLEQEFSRAFPEVSIVCVIGDVRNRVRVERTMRTYMPLVVFHAAAYKHVPMMEEVNSWEAVQNNVWGTYVVANAAVAAGVERFVLVSTDKAINPTNVMGATKRLAEIVCQSLQQRSNTCFQIVRFGNVLGSAGSVIPKFHEQIASGGPVTVTHPDIIRYFMSIPEAAQLVLQAGCMGQGGEVFVLDMGEPVKIVDLAREMIRLAGFTEDEITIVYTGLRPGEKLFEELLADNEKTRPSDHPKLRIAKANGLEHFDAAELVRWLQQNRDVDDEEVRRDLKRWVPEYSVSVRPKLKVV